MLSIQPIASTKGSRRRQSLGFLLFPAKGIAMREIAANKSATPETDTKQFL